MQPDLVDKIARTPQSQILIFAACITVARILLYFYLIKQPKHISKSLGNRILNGITESMDSIIYAAIFIFLVIRPFVFQTFRIPSGSMVPTMQVGDFIGLNKAIYRYTEPIRGDIVVFRPPVEACYPEQISPDGTVNVDFVKRLVGMPGDVLEIRDGQTYVNGKPLPEPYKQLTEGIEKTADNNPVKFRIYSEAERLLYTKLSWKLVKRDGELIPLNYTADGANVAMGAGYSVAPKYVINDPSEMTKLKAAPAEAIPAGYFLFIGDNRNNSFDGRGWGLVPRESVVGRAEFIWLPIPRIGKPQYVPNNEVLPK
jgi:signal peptidase I